MSRFPPKLTYFFIIDPPALQFMATYLTASVRHSNGWECDLIGYCDVDLVPHIDPMVRRLLDQYGCEIRTFDPKGAFSPAYPHGNKILACLENRETDFSCFLDSDIIVRLPIDWKSFCHPGQVALCPATGPGSTTEELWAKIYDHFGMQIPEERISFTRKRRGEYIPYFNAGVFYFDEAHRSASGKSFPEVYMETALEIDTIDTVDQKRPYLDQYALPVAIQRADMTWNILPDGQNYSLGGRKRGRPLPDDIPVQVVHYRHWAFLEEAQVMDYALGLLDGDPAHDRLKDIMDMGKVNIHDHPDFKIERD